MSIISKKLINLEKLLNIELSIPHYQRPYKWTVRNVNHLFNDILEACRNNLSAYRIGTIIVHRHGMKESSPIRDIVDGQQRTISLHLLNYVLQASSSVTLPKNKSNISQNYYEMKRLYHSLITEEKEKFKKYFAEKCHVILIEIDNEMEAFQFFDSQNSRGKSLEAHDLLKAYHLREMKTEQEETKLKLVEKWENQASSELSMLFIRYLYKVKAWMNQKGALYFQRDGIEMFKGVPLEHRFSFIQYHKAAYLFIEKFNRENHQELLGIDALIPYQLDQPILAGRRFFEFTLHYITLKKKVEQIVLDILPESVSPAYVREPIGTRYIRELFQSLLLFFYDRFGTDYRNHHIEHLFFTYCYQLRCLNHAVYEKSVNKYALGKNERLNFQLNLFEEIKNATNPRELEMIRMDDIYINQITTRYTTEEFAELRKQIGVMEDEREG